MRPPVDITAPDFPADTRWVNTHFVRLGTLLGRNAALVWFWDLASLNSLRALPYLLEWHRRYEAVGLRVLGVADDVTPPKMAIGLADALLEVAREHDGLTEDERTMLLARIIGHGELEAALLSGFDDGPSQDV